MSDTPAIPFGYRLVTGQLQKGDGLWNGTRFRKVRREYPFIGNREGVAIRRCEVVQNVIAETRARAGRGVGGGDFMRTLLLIAMLALSGCSDKPEIKDKPEELAKLPEGTQIAFVLRDPALLLGLAAIAWAINPRPFIKVKLVKKNGEDTEKDEP